MSKHLIKKILKKHAQNRRVEEKKYFIEMNFRFSADVDASIYEFQLKRAHTFLSYHLIISIMGMYKVASGG